MRQSMTIPARHWLVSISQLMVSKHVQFMVFGLGTDQHSFSGPKSAVESFLWPSVSQILYPAGGDGPYLDAACILLGDWELSCTSPSPLWSWFPFGSLCELLVVCSSSGVSWNGGTPKSSILVGFSLINHPAIGDAADLCDPVQWFVWGPRSRSSVDPSEVFESNFLPRTGPEVEQELYGGFP